MIAALYEFSPTYKVALLRKISPKWCTFGGRSGSRKREGVKYFILEDLDQTLHWHTWDKK